MTHKVKYIFECDKNKNHLDNIIRLFTPTLTLRNIRHVYYCSSWNILLI